MSDVKQEMMTMITPERMADAIKAQEELIKRAAEGTINVLNDRHIRAGYQKRLDGFFTIVMTDDGWSCTMNPEFAKAIGQKFGN